MFDEFLASNPNILDNYQKLCTQQSLETTILSDVAKLVSYQLSFSQKLLLFASHFRKTHCPEGRYWSTMKYQTDDNIKSADGLNYLDLIYFLKQLVFGWISETGKNDEDLMEEIHSLYNTVLEQRNNIFLNFRLRFPNISVFQIKEKEHTKTELPKTLDFSDIRNIRLLFKEFGEKKNYDEIDEIAKGLLSTLKELIIYKSELKFKSMLDLDLIKNPPIDILRESPIYYQYQKYQNGNEFLVKKNIISTNKDLINLRKSLLTTINAFDVQSLITRDHSVNEINKIESQFLLFKINFLESINQLFSKYHDEHDISIIRNYYSKEYEVYQSIQASITDSSTIIRDSCLCDQDFELAISHEISRQTQFAEKLASFQHSPGSTDASATDSSITSLRESISKLSLRINEAKEHVAQAISSAVRDFQTQISAVEIPPLRKSDYANCAHCAFSARQQRAHLSARASSLRAQRSALAQRNARLSARAKALCPLCRLRKRAVVFAACGHTFCARCAGAAPACPHCAAPAPAHPIKWH